MSKTESSNLKMVSLCGEVCLEVIVSPGVDGDPEIQNIHDISIMIGSGVGKAIHVNLDGFGKGFHGTVADVIMKQQDKLYALIAEQERKERAEEGY